MTRDHWQQIQELLDLESGLTEWEIKFLDDIFNKGDGYILSVKQIAVLDRIYDRVKG